MLRWWLLSLGDIPVLDVCFNYLFDLLFLSASSTVSGAQALDMFGGFPQVRGKSEGRSSSWTVSLKQLSSSGHNIVFHAAIASWMLFPQCKSLFWFEWKIPIRNYLINVYVHISMFWHSFPFQHLYCAFFLFILFCISLFVSSRP